MRNLIKLHSRAPLAVRLLTYYFLLIILLPLVEQYVIDAYVASEFYWIKPAIELSVRVAFGISLFWVFRTVDWKLNAAQGHASESTRLLLERLAMASALRAMGSNPHSERISRYAALVAEELGLPADQVEIVRSAAALHDVGKLAIPDRILLKPGVLTPEQRELMQEHVFYGADLLAGGNEPVMQAAYNIALTHHEAWNGRGYPNGLSGARIPLCGRIVSICDTFEALISERPYKEAWPIHEAVLEILRLSGKRFDPVVVNAFYRALPRIEEVTREEVCERPIRNVMRHLPVEPVTRLDASHWFPDAMKAAQDANDAALSKLLLTNSEIRA